MDILYVGMDNSPYAGRSHEVKVAEELARRGHNVHLVVERQPTWTTASPKPENMKVTIAPVNDASKAISIAKDLPTCDVGFGSSVSSAPLLAAWKTRTKRPVVTQVLDVPVWRLSWGQRAPWYDQWAPWHRALYEMDRLIVNTKQTEGDIKTTRELYQESRPTPPMTVVYYGIDVEEADRAKAQKRPEGGYPMAVGVSRLVPYKGFDLAIASLSTLKEKIAYYIVGDGEDLARLAHMDQMLFGGCTFTGGISDKSKFEVIKSSDFGLFLAYNPHIPAQFPMESAYCGKPCIVADTPVNRERFLDCGVRYVNPANTQEVANALREWREALPTGIKLATGPDEWREWIRENRSFQSHAAGVLQVLEAL